MQRVRSHAYESNAYKHHYAQSHAHDDGHAKRAYVSLYIPTHSIAGWL